jgi:hypothetical protein
MTMLAESVRALELRVAVAAADRATRAAAGAGGQKELSWNQTGPQGPAGATGPAGPAGPSTAGSSGLDVTEVTGSASGSGPTTAVCPPSHPYVIGGGFRERFRTQLDRDSGQ